VDHGEACGSSNSAREQWGIADVEEILMMEEAASGQCAPGSVGVGLSSKLLLHHKGRHLCDSPAWTTTGGDDNGWQRW
jgi:hypothetical protein